jgi:hypothetical protein
VTALMLDLNDPPTAGICSLESKRGAAKIGSASDGIAVALVMVALRVKGVDVCECLKRLRVFISLSIRPIRSALEISF